MKRGDLVRINLPLWYQGIDHVNRSQGKIGIITEIEHIDNGTRMGHRRGHVLVEGDMRQYEVKYLELISEAG